jgi:hypothetical protein
MRWRIVGIVLLLVSLVLGVMLSVDFPLVQRSNVLLEQEGILLPFMYPFGEPPPALVLTPNVTLTPFSRTNYIVEVLVVATVWNTTKWDPKNATVVDLWVLNQTGAQSLLNYVENNSTYPVNPYVSGVKTYAKVLNMGSPNKNIVRLEGLNYDGIYFVALINPYREADANITLVIEETYWETGRIIPPNYITLAFTAALAVVGLYVVVKGPAWSNPKTRRRRPRP